MSPRVIFLQFLTGSKSSDEGEVGEMGDEGTARLAAEGRGTLPSAQRPLRWASSESGAN